MHRRSVAAFRALSDPNRLRIVKMLGERDLCVCEIQEILGLSVSTVSKHLSILRDAGIIADAKDGKWVNYRLNRSVADSLVASLLKTIQKSFDDEVVVRSDRKKVRTVDRNKLCNL